MQETSLLTLSGKSQDFVGEFTCYIYTLIYHYCRKKYLFSNAEKEAKKGNPMSKAYLNWLKKVRQEDSQLGAGASNLLNLAEESHKLLGENEDSFRVIPKYKMPSEKESEQEETIDVQSNVTDEEPESRASQSKRLNTPTLLTFAVRTSSSEPREYSNEYFENINVLNEK